MNLWQVNIVFAAHETVELFFDHDPTPEFITPSGLLPKSVTDVFGRSVALCAAVPKFVTVQSMNDLNRAKEELTRMNMRAENKIRQKLGKEFEADPLNKLTGADGRPLFGNQPIPQR